MNKLCIYCKKITQDFSNEHVIPKALGGNIILKNAVCHSCNNAFSKEFERSAFKGENSLLAFIRSWTGMKGRKEVPIFGTEKHGQPVLLTLKEGYPQIREYIVNKEPFYYPQFIINFKDGTTKRYDYKKENNKNFKEDIEKMIIEEEINENEIKKLYFWCDSKTTSIYGYRLFDKSLREWAESNNVDCELFDETAKGKSAYITMKINWKTIERLFSKMLLNFLFYKIRKPNYWFLPIFDDIRNFIRYGKGEPGHLLWKGNKPRADFLNDKLITILCNTNMIMSYSTKVEMSGFKDAIMPENKGGCYGGGGHYHDESERTKEITRNT